MSEQIAPLTYEGILEMVRQAHLRMDRMSEEAERRSKEAERKSEKVWAQIERTSKEVSALGSRVGEIVENMVGGDIVEQFQALGYAVTGYSRNKVFGIKGKGDDGEIDLFLEDGDVAILVEARTTLKIDDVKEHIEKLEKYRRHVEANGNTDKRKFIGAVATGSAAENVIKFAHRQGLYVIVQAGRTVEILPPPAGFVAKKW